MSSQTINKHVTGVASPKLVPATGAGSRQPTVTAAARKSACLGGQSLTGSTAKRLLAGPACRGGRMMPEQTAKHRPAKKKPKPKHTATKLAADENCSSSKCAAEQKSQPHRPALACASQNTITPTATVSDRPKSGENVPARTLPRIVIKIHQGRIVSPSAIASSPASSISVKKHATEQQNSAMVGSQESRTSDAIPQRTEKSEQISPQSLLKPAKLVAGSKSLLKNASQSVSSKALPDRSSNIAYFDGNQLQNSGSFDKLSLDCCMKLYSQLNDKQKPSQPSQSLSDSGRPLKHSSTAKSCHTSSGNRTVGASGPKKRSPDKLKQTSFVFESLPKMRTVDGECSTSQTSDCTVHLNRIRSVNDIRAPVRQLPDADSRGIQCTVRYKSSYTRDRQPGGTTYDFAASADEDLTDDCCSVTLTPRSHAAHTEAPIPQTDVLTATESVPGSSVPLSKPRQSFSKRSHTPTKSESSSPKKSRVIVSTSPSESSEKSQIGLLSSLLSADDECTNVTVKKPDRVLTGINLTHFQTASCDDKHCRAFEVPNAADCWIQSKSSSIRHVKKASVESTGESVSDAECGRSSVAPVGQKHCVSADGHNPDLSSAVSKPGSAKKSRLSNLPGEAPSQLTAESLASGIVDKMADTNSLCCSSCVSPGIDEVSPDTAVPQLFTDTEPPSCDVGRISPTDSPAGSQTFESSTLPLRLKIRRLHDVSPVREIYNVIGQNAESDSASSLLCSMYHY